MTDNDPKIVPLNEFLAAGFQQSFGITREEAWDKGICVQCREEAGPRCYSEAGRKEYLLSAMCERCWDDLMAEPEE